MLVDLLVPFRVSRACADSIGERSVLSATERKGITRALARPIFAFISPYTIAHAPAKFPKVQRNHTGKHYRLWSESDGVPIGIFHSSHRRKRTLVLVFPVGRSRSLRLLSCLKWSKGDQKGHRSSQFALPKARLLPKASLKPLYSFWTYMGNQPFHQENSKRSCGPGQVWATEQER
jgi:hypothetical protein